MVPPDGEHQATTTTSDFNEFEDREYADWKRVRSAIEHENDLTHHRVTWLLTTQGFLMTAYALLLNQWAKPKDNTELALDIYPYLFALIVLNGGFICLVIRNLLVHGAVQLHRLDKWWHSAPELRGWENISSDDRDPKLQDPGRIKRSPTHPPIQGGVKRPSDAVLSIANLPILFVVMWIVAGGVSVVYPAASILIPTLPKQISTKYVAALTLVALVLGYGWARLPAWRRKLR